MSGILVLIIVFIFGLSTAPNADLAFGYVVGFFAGVMTLVVAVVNNSKTP